MRFVRVVVRGRVQGVGYRWHAREAARRHGVAGWVRNRSDGSVEAELIGDAAAVEQVLSALRRGPSASQVRSVETDEIADVAVRQSRGFEIRPTE